MIRRLFLYMIFFFLLAAGNHSNAQKIIDFLTAVPQQGEGIYSLLRRYGLNADSNGYRAFVSLNVNRLKENDSLHPGVEYTLPVIDISFDEPFDSVLRKLGVLDYRKEIIAYNITWNPGFIADEDRIPDSQRILIPEPGCGYYSVERDTDPVKTLPPSVITAEDEHEYSVPYPEIKKRFKAGSKSTKLNNYCFVIDPGHGGKDPGTNPFVKQGDGLDAHAFEAPLVFDTSLRLMKHIVENGGEAFLTHYSTRYGIRDIKNPQDYSKQKYNISTRNISTDTPAQSLRERKAITQAIIKNKYNKGRKVVFISIHADYLPDKTRDLPITILYSRHTSLDNNRSRRFAEKLAVAVTGSSANSRGMGLGVLYNNPADLEVLVELANLNNSHGAWRLRYHSYREKLAEILCKGLIDSLD